MKKSKLQKQIVIEDKSILPFSHYRNNKDFDRYSDEELENIRQTTFELSHILYKLYAQQMELPEEDRMPEFRNPESREK
jgi:hypothetical protein